MTKDEALRLLGGTPSTAARALGIASQAIYSWPPAPAELPRRISDRVLAALARKHIGEDTLVAIAEARWPAEQGKK